VAVGRDRDNDERAILFARLRKDVTLDDAHANIFGISLS
jgi:hypothetical protein